MREGVEDVVFCYLRFPSGRVAHMHLSWLDPHKERRFTVVGDKRMATFDDMALERKVTDLRQGLRPRLPQLRRVHHALGRRHEPPDLERGAAADRVPRTSSSACAREPSRSPAPQSRPARGAGARGAAALARGGRRPAAAAGCRAAWREALRPPIRPRARADARPRRRARRRPRARRVGRRPQRHRGRRRLRDPGRGGARQAAAPGRALDCAAGGSSLRSRSAPEAVICAGAVVYAGARLGAGAIVGDQAQVRERVERGRRAPSSAAAAAWTTTSRSAPACGSSPTATWPPTR